MKEFAPAKINLFLDVIRKREDGYHDLGTVFQTIDAGDTVSATPREDGTINLTYNKPQEYPVESDLVYKAAVALRAQAGNPLLGADIYLDKVMPLGAGLGGGSADAAATLRWLNRLWELRLPPTELERIGAKLGADGACQSPAPTAGKPTSPPGLAGPKRKGLSATVCSIPARFSTLSRFPCSRSTRLSLR